MVKIQYSSAKILVMLLAVGLLAASFVPAASALADRVDPWSRMHPVLRQVAHDHPKQLVRVILRYTGDEQKAVHGVTWLGGVVLNELPIINSLVVEIPAAALLEVATLSAVQWLSPDAGMVESFGVNQLVYTTWAGAMGYINEPISQDFNHRPISAGSTLWFSTVAKTKYVPKTGATVRLEDVVIEFESGGVAYRVELPDSTIRYTANNEYSSTYFDSDTNRWITTTSATNEDDVFATGVPFVVDTTLPGGLKNVRGQARVVSNTTDLEVAWGWAASVFSSFSSELNGLGVKPVQKIEAHSLDPNERSAGTPESYRQFLVAGGTGDDDSTYRGDYSVSKKLMPGFADSGEMARSIGPDNVFAEGRAQFEAVSGFQGEFTPGYVISKVELVLKGYVNASLSSDVVANLALDGWKQQFVVTQEAFQPVVGNAGEVVVDVTSLRRWHWSDFANHLQLRLDQTGFAPGHSVFYDAIGLRVTSVVGTPSAAVKLPTVTAGKAIKTNKLGNAFPYAVRATNIWNEGPAYLQGQGVTIAIVDSGIGKNKSLSRNFLDVNFNPEYRDGTDRYGHGTFVAMLAAGDGRGSGNRYMGIAPRANLLNARVTNDYGMTTESTIIEALQWVLLNKNVYNIRVVNLSLNSSVAQSYHTSPLDAAVEILWFNGIVVVVSAGNNGTSTLFPPANDPFVLTVGATDDQGTPGMSDDSMASFSAYGEDEKGQVKPDIVAPGRNIVTYLPGNDQMTMGNDHPDNRVGKTEFRMSGTSMAAPMVAGAVAILLQDEPGLTPDQVKARLKATANKDWDGYSAAKSGAGYLDVYAAVHGNGLESANQGLQPSRLLWTGSEAVSWTSGFTWSSVNWNSVNWNSVNWNSVNWNSVDWNSVDWHSDVWGDVESVAVFSPLDITKQPVLFLPLVGNE